MSIIHGERMSFKNIYMFWMNQENCKSWNKYVEKQKDFVANKTFMTRAFLKIMVQNVVWRLIFHQLRTKLIS
jgi:hypothetical protein